VRPRAENRSPGFLAEPIEQALSAYVILPQPVITITGLALVLSLPIAWILRSE